jgi:ADP-ribosyl-[dinitrogen reductase] hydrolase
MSLTKDHIYSILFGVAVGDALGVPVEFKSREFLSANPVMGMQGFGTHHQPAGTWSDDSTMTFCLAESLLDESFDLRNLANRFINWFDFGYWTPWGKVFDIGNTTAAAINRLRSNGKPEDAGGTQESDNGNGSLMRILPLVMKTIDLPPGELFEIVKKVSSLTHAHIQSVSCCFYYLVYASQLINGLSANKAYEQTNKIVVKTLMDKGVPQEAFLPLNRILSGKRVCGSQPGILCLVFTEYKFL